VAYTGDMKTCAKCAALKPLDEFHRAPTGATKRQSWCKECHRAWQRASRLADPEKNRESQRRLLRQLRQDVLDALGCRCATCGYDADVLGLEIDHVREDGHLDRRDRKNGLARSTYYRNMLRSISTGGDHGLQVLCGTCHSIKTRSAQYRDLP
jgi:hypothetical protein